jgi:DNA-binding NarL/FixJ family response regulator
MRRTLQTFLVLAMLLVSVQLSSAKDEQTFASIYRFCSASTTLERDAAADQLTSQLSILAKKKAYHWRIAADAAQEAFVYVILNCHRFADGRWDSGMVPTIMQKAISVVYKKQMRLPGGGTNLGVDPNDLSAIAEAFDTKDFIKSLKPRELEVLTARINGDTTQMIASDLGISADMVRYYLRQAKAKFYGWNS